ncbi:MAG: HlyD family efflux transporter periplasmic adaptor subunit [Phycisphaerales bacterium]|nr:HlyD family efflux transporter periplasmic adaptor subunit [Phycisphaerales bacterium]
MSRIIRRIITIVLVLAALGLAAYALRPKPVAVDVATVTTATMQVTVDEDARTRIKERYIVSAPLAGRLARITLKEGDPVVASDTLIASIDPPDPSLLDPRARAEAEARVNAAIAVHERTATDVSRAAAGLELAQTELQRVQDASAGGGTSALEVDRAQAAAMIAIADARAADVARDIARYELDLARAALLRTTGASTGDVVWRFPIDAPVSGRVLRVFQESAGVVAAGAPLVEIGDPTDLELVADVLSTDAVGIRPGAPVRLEHWGGEATLHGRVRLVEPAAFTKVSALGVEEQRVNVVIDFVDPPAARAGLGDAYRVEVRIVVWEADDVLTVPTAALFRHADSWAVYGIRDGRVVQRDVTIGRRNALQAQVLGGLAAGETVIVFPGDAVRPGVRVQPRTP